MRVLAYALFIALRVLVIVAALPWLVVLVVQIFLMGSWVQDCLEGAVPGWLGLLFERWESFPPWYACLIVATLLFAGVCPWTSPRRRALADEYDGFKTALPPTDRGTLTAPPLAAQPVEPPVLNQRRLDADGTYRGMHRDDEEREPACPRCSTVPASHRRPAWLLALRLGHAELLMTDSPGSWMIEAIDPARAEAIESSVLSTVEMSPPPIASEGPHIRDLRRPVCRTGVSRTLLSRAMAAASV